MIKHANKEIKITTVVVYDKDTGNIVHRHRQTEKEIDKDHILQFVRPEFKKDNLEILEISENDMVPDKKYKVNHASGSLVQIP